MFTRRNRCSFPRIPVTCAGIELITVWDVLAGSDYVVQADRSRHDSHVKIAKGGQHCVALRTHRGGGEVKCAGTVFRVGEGDLLLFQFSELEHYRAAEATWDFWWFEFRPAEPLRLPLQRLMHAAVSQGEAKECGQLFDSLRSERLPERCRAGASFQALLHGWWSSSNVLTEDSGPHSQTVHRLIEAIHTRPEMAWTLEDMSREAGVCISSLRAAFRAATGETPARIRNSLRLTHAYERLRHGHHTVAEISDKLGFCDPFHFSKAFKREFGFPPSRIPPGG